MLAKRRKISAKDQCLEDGRRLEKVLGRETMALHDQVDILPRAAIGGRDLFDCRHAPNLAGAR